MATITAVINFAVMMIGYTVCNPNVTDCSYTPMAGNTPKFSNTFIFIIHPCDSTVVICYLIWPCDIDVRITYLISHSSSLSYNAVITGYF